MTGDRAPEVSVSKFPSPPFEFDDGEQRSIEVRPVEGDDVDGLYEMYLEFDPRDRAQGVPPAREEPLRDWLDIVLEGINVAAWHSGGAAGHATLIHDEDADAHELAIFVLQSYQGAGVGSKLIQGAFSEGYERGVREVWLTVERWNRSAIGLYRKTGLQEVGGSGLEIEMAAKLVE